MNIGVVGAGYVGLVTAACFARLGNNVVNVDINSEKIKSLKKGISESCDFLSWIFIISLLNA